MSLEEIVTKTWNFLPHFQFPEQPSSTRLIDRFIRLKTTYWNREYAVVFLGLIGLFIMSLQSSLYYTFIWFTVEQNQIHYSHYDCLSYNTYGFYISLIAGGVLATVYPAHNILGIFLTISSIGHLILVMTICYLNTHTHSVLRFLIGVAQAVSYASLYGVWTCWIPLNKQSIRHVPIVLFILIEEGGYLHDTIDKLHVANSSYTLTLFIGVIGLVWYVLWLYVINGQFSCRSLNRNFILFGGSNNPRYYSETSFVSLTRSIVSDIPWKSICSSKPVLAIALLYACDARLSEINIDDLYNSNDVIEWTMRNYTVTLLLLFVVLVELVPEITVSISTTNVRKFWSCSYFGLMGLFFILEAILGNILGENNFIHYMTVEMQYLNNFGFYVNILDIAPKYACLIDCFLWNLHNTTNFLCVKVVNIILSSGILNKVESAILMSIICFAAAVSYFIFGSAEIQPWATDEPVEENQPSMVENDNKL